MIVTRKQMIDIEENSGMDTLTLMERAGSACAWAIRSEIQPGSHVLILAGKGNNGGDGLVIARCLTDCFVRVFLTEGTVSTDAAKASLSRLPEEIFVTENRLEEALAEADILIDCIYGFSYHGPLRKPARSLFRKINASRKRVFSVDLNSGCEADSGWCDSDAIVSELTFALDCAKPFHLLRKDHHKFAAYRIVPLSLPHPATNEWMEMDEERFFSYFERKKEDSYKNSFGQLLLAGGSYGMAGALGLNILGARTPGASYIHVMLPDPVYPILASRFLTPVYHPVKEDAPQVLSSLLKSVKAAAFGSGAVAFPEKEACLRVLLEEAEIPVVLDAEALRLLKGKEDLLSHSKGTFILTPHIGELSWLTGLSIREIQEDKLKIVSSFARATHAIVLLKGSHTIAASPDGDIYINQSGCEALAQAGSGDLLTGILAAVLLHCPDVFKAVCMAVWLHGFLSEPQMHAHSMQAFPLEKIPEVMDSLLRKHGL